MTNEEVIDYNDEHDADLNPWDPDNDDDGLTDGQEVHGLNEVDIGEEAGPFQSALWTTYGEN